LASDRVGIGVVGVNPRIRRVILGGIRDSRRARVAAVVSRDAAKAAGVASEFGGRPYTRLEDMVADSAVDVVFVCTPHHLHHPMSLTAFQAGKRVICEKPLASTVAEAEELAAIARSLGTPNLVNFTYHSLPGHRSVARLLRENTIGRLRHLDLTYWQARQRLPNATPGNALLEIGSHQIDLVQWWCDQGEGGEIVDVTADHAPRSDDNATIITALGRTTAGVLVSIQANRVAAGWRNGMVCRLVGLDGMLTLTFDTDKSEVSIARFGEGSAEGVTRVLPIPPDLAVSYADFPSYHIDRLVAALDGETSFPDFSYALRCQRVLDAIQTSIDEHRWVRLSDFSAFE
jgi:predicted dehydrogenase